MGGNPSVFIHACARRVCAYTGDTGADVCGKPFRDALIIALSGQLHQDHASELHQDHASEGSGGYGRMWQGTHAGAHCVTGPRGLEF